MLDLWQTFCGYVQINYQKLIWVVLFAMVFYIGFRALSIRGSKKDILFRVMLSMACSFIFVMTLLGRGHNETSSCLRPFWSYVGAYEAHNSELLLQNIVNVLMYIPLGFCLPACFVRCRKMWRTIPLLIAVAVTIEVIQGTCKIGHADIDDILNNTIGALIGYGMYVVYKVCCARVLKGKQDERESEKTC